MRSLRAWVLAAAVSAGCLDPNAEFDGPVTSTNASGDGDDAAASGTTEADEPVACEDPFEPNDVDPVDVAVGSFTAVIEGPEAVDRYRIYLAPPEPVQVWATADRDDMRACILLHCDMVNPTPAITCIEGLSASNGNGDLGCCGGSHTALSWTCEVGTAAKLQIVFDEGPQECFEYGFEIGTDPL